MSSIYRTTYHNTTQTSTTSTVEPNAESLGYIKTIIEIQHQQTLEKYDDQIEKILDSNSKLPTNIPIADKALVDAITYKVKQDSSNISSNEQNYSSNLLSL